jgi:hypothetical protein
MPANLMSASRGIIGHRKAALNRSKMTPSGHRSVARSSGPHLPVIRIYSERRGPERVVFDTRTVIPAPNGSTRRKRPGSGSRQQCLGQLTQCFRTNAAIRPGPGSSIRSKDAGAEATTVPADRDPSRGPKHAGGLAATAIWLVCQSENLVSE